MKLLSLCVGHVLVPSLTPWSLGIDKAGKASRIERYKIVSSPARKGGKHGTFLAPMCKGAKQSRRPGNGGARMPRGPAESHLAEWHPTSQNSTSQNSMSQNSVATVQITYQVPPRGERSRSSSRHERRLEGVPEPTAQQMLDDFAAYEASRGRVNQYEAYTYRRSDPGEPAGGEVMVALDFGEIAALQVEEGLQAESGESTEAQTAQSQEPVFA